MAATTRITVLYFAAAREKAGTGRESAELPGSATVADVRRWASARHPELTGLLKHLRIAVDEEFVEDDAPLKTGCEVALIPPVAGG